MKNVIKIKNNNVTIGKITLDLENLKAFAFIAGLSIVVISSGAVIKHAKDDVIKSNNQKTLEDDNHKYSFDTTPTYEVNYEVCFGDTLEGIVSAYQSDPNKMYPIIDDITRVNHLSSKSSLKDGNTIKLVGVPEEHLADFGYTIDYSQLSPECELEDLSSFIDDEITRLVLTDENEQRLASFEAKYSYARMLYDSYLKDKDELIVDSLLEQYRSLGQEIADIVGVDYNKSIKAHKIEIEKEMQGPTL